MSGMDAAGFAAYAREQIRAADVILARHRGRVGVCSCGRLLPCSAAASVAGRRRHFVDRLGQVEASTVLGSARVGGPLEGEIVPTSRGQPCRYGAIAT
ncbi:MAG: hypothetical protein GEU94_07370 [Micromonosporaceae bacterium]|nr:hypothetical protein [Micromonosporaceae bacterium]